MSNFKLVIKGQKEGRKELEVELIRGQSGIALLINDHVAFSLEHDGTYKISHRYLGEEVGKIDLGSYL